MIRSSCRLAGLTAVAMCAFVGAGRADDRPAITVGVQQLSVFNVLSSVREYSNVGLRTFNAFVEPLIDYERTNPALPVKPGLAESWKRVDDKTIELVLRKGVKFHNGDEMTSADVVFTFGPEHMFGRGDAKADGTGKEPPASAVGAIISVWPKLDRVEAIDKYTVRFVNKVADPTMEGRLSRTGSEIISKRGFEEAKSWNDFAKAPVGTGPYKVKEYIANQYLLLAAHDDYWGGKPPAKEVRWLETPEVDGRVNGLVTGKFDFITDIPPDQVKPIEASAKHEVVGGPVNNIRMIVFDKTHPTLKDPRIRRALAMAVDQKLIAETIFSGRVSVPKGLQFPFYGDLYLKDWDTLKHDPEGAKKLLTEAGYKGEAIPFRGWTTNYYTNQVPVTQVLVEMWRAVGINIKLELYDNWSPIIKADPGRGMRDWSNSAPFNDPVASINSQHCQLGAQQRWGEWTNEEFNTLCTALESSQDLATRQKSFRRMLEIIEREDPGYIILHQTTLLYGKRKDLDWKYSPTQGMDLGPANLKIKK
jgi:peptide/nickel transport system substrate-binding protein